MSKSPLAVPGRPGPSRGARRRRRLPPPKAVTFGVVSDVPVRRPSRPRAPGFYDRSWLKLRGGPRRIQRPGRPLRRPPGRPHRPRRGELRPHPAGLRGTRARPCASSSATTITTSPQRTAPGSSNASASRPGYYAFTEGNWRFVVLNGDELAVNSPKDEGLEPGGRRDVRRAPGREAGPTRRSGTAASGGPRWPSSRTSWRRPTGTACPPSSSATSRSTRRPRHNLWNDGEVVARLERHPSVKAYFAGHNHDGGLAVKNGIVYLTFAGMVETPDTSASAVVTLEAGPPCRRRKRARARPDRPPLR
ncbi:MAG: hypothetical protein M0C28_01610 [Candidatus Moduliflexus flocculans]|nr:hypothetical protein [Candidatus Moduliflexus flocculans]